jgi:hypothetical protein
LLLEWVCQQPCRRQVALRINRTRAVGSTMTATNNISTHLTGDAGVTFCNPLAFVEGRYRASRARVVTSDFSATPKPLTALSVNNLLSPIRNIRAIPRKLCKRLSLAIVDDHRP